jgi:hypothetical protein
VIFSFFWSEILAIYLSFLQLSCTAVSQLFPIRPGMAQVFIDKGVAILDLPMILLPNEIINKYMQNMKN